MQEYRKERRNIEREITYQNASAKQQWVMCWDNDHHREPPQALLSCFRERLGEWGENADVLLE